LSKNKLLTKDNLYKRREVEDKACLFCGEHETVYHLFYECVVAKQAWNVVSEVIGSQIGYDFESMAKCWLCNNKFGLVNMLSSAVCWSLWKLRNLICFQGAAWCSMKGMWCLVLLMLKCRKVLTPVKGSAGLEDVISCLEARVWWPERLLAAS
jgi:hypothetical protein